MRLALILALAAAVAAQDPKEIFRRSVEKDQVNRSLQRQYTYLEKTVQKEFKRDGKVKSSESTVRDISILYGHQFSRLIEKNGKPLSEKDEQKQRERLEKFTAQWENETPEERAKRQALREKNRERNQAFLREMTDAFDFQLLGEEKIAGKDAWVIQAEPRPGYRAKLAEAKYFAKVHGKVWIDEAEYQWVKVEAETIDTISFGLVLFRLYKGSRMEFEQTRINDEIWLPKSQHLAAAGRMGVFVRASVDLTTSYENYRKFQTDSKVTGVVEEK